MKRYFGTDGIRGVANKDLTPELAFRVGRVLGFLLQKGEELKTSRRKVLIGKDTRLSCGMLEAALSAGFASQGIDVVQVGVIPTPGVAYLTRTMDFAAGAMISASHNPAEDNGIKFFSHQGFKFPDDFELRIEKLLDTFGEVDFIPCTGDQVGTLQTDLTLTEKYLEYLESVEPLPLQGVKMVVDTANGATYQLAPAFFKSLGAEVVILFDRPDGLNINADCGSTHMKNLQQAVLEHRAHLGLAFDGDGDRVLAVDEKGQLMDGDQIMLAAALELMKTSAMKSGLVISTVMSNFGFEEALKQNGIELKRAAVGDRYVLEEMQKSGALLGGEQSGHIIFLEHNTVGDGLITALKLLSAYRRRGVPLSELAALMTHYPQVLLNVRVQNKKGWEENPAISQAIESAQREIEGNGRLLVRASGTEPLIRVMVEGKNAEHIHKVADYLADLIRAELN